MNQFEIGSSQWQGKRAYQQDSLRAQYLPEGGVFAVLADGMGGAKGGEVASLAAVDAVFDAFDTEYADLSTHLLELVGKANNAIAREIRANPDLDGMGTTLVIVLIRDQTLHWVSVGDSPVYLFGDQEISQINLDESYGGHLDRRAQRGEITHAEAKADTRRHQLMNVLMGQQSLTIEDCQDEGISLNPGDIVILASDGIQTLSEEVICQHLLDDSLTADELNHNLLSNVVKCDRPNQDNVSLICIRVLDEENS
ncbi:MAG: serine/threonine-protein phosphatase [Gammaproteobacteria bacterium]|nr:serine/threonine-protein phosphatase [Gammaproteobacteria bacterium]